MDSTTQSITPLRQRMLDDMRMRKLSDKTHRFKHSTSQQQEDRKTGKRK